MNKFKIFIKYHLDQIISIGGATVIVCLVLKFMDVPGSDYIFCSGLLIEAFIFALGVFRPSEMPNIDEYQNNKLNYNDFYQNTNIKNNNDNNILQKSLFELENVRNSVNNIKNQLNNSAINKPYNGSQNYNYTVNSDINWLKMNDSFFFFFNNLDNLRSQLQESNRSSYSNSYNNSSIQTNMNSDISAVRSDNKLYSGILHNISDDTVKIIDSYILGLHSDLNALSMTLHPSSNISEKSTAIYNSAISGPLKKKRGRPPRPKTPSSVDQNSDYSKLI